MELSHLAVFTLLVLGGVTGGIALVALAGRRDRDRGGGG